jgi:hypothetical protein
VLAHPHRPTLVPSPSNGRRVWCTGDSPATPLVSSRCQRLAVAVAHGEQRGGCYGRGRVVMRVMRLWRLAEHARRGRHGLLTPWTSTMRRRRASISKPPLACIANEAPHASSNTPKHSVTTTAGPATHCRIMRIHGPGHPRCVGGRTDPGIRSTSSAALPRHEPDCRVPTLPRRHSGPGRSPAHSLNAPKLALWGSEG